MSAKSFQSFEEFYPFYITEHQNKTSRTLHFIGTFISSIPLTVSFEETAWLMIGDGIVNVFSNTLVLVAWPSWMVCVTTTAISLPSALTSISSGLRIINIKDLEG